ncbi:inositol phospholipid synthesis and fat-storage-inducing TM-domain-containing protein [Xylaria bambusicola]|uniref:inositol phospholipid synthesis and fat-storage-inducing TM-domain-containing protein n=1 Tax=Xylaria bambusicola TaxID=326684 RepID=UPI002008ABD2|nr:inositol phospholipid synthesis and fat-storage-inducing TM-domain-containing protein [Xylaria bambusicola]KAI0528018.1 inositol phospholipid synthesis and fat-storage-inducing TM-domain-containing protein [Xylaria bambusicola]
MAEDNVHSLRSRGVPMNGSDSINGATFTTSPKMTSATTTTSRSSPFLPTPLETLLLAVYPTILIFGTLFSALSPETRGAPYDTIRQSHVQATAPSYFARKDNLFNVLFVKRGWLWITGSFLAFVATHPTFRNGNGRQIAKAATRWAIVTGWWILVTQWCFGPPIIDRGFRFTGGRCEVAQDAVSSGTADQKELFTAVACRTAGGNWSGGHDISGHVFLLVLGSCFLAQEVVWVVLRAGARIAGSGDDRAIVMDDGAHKGARAEAEYAVEGHEKHLGFGGKFALGVVGLSLWMLLMTATYFHTWFEKLTGLLVASMAVYTVYILPRWAPALRAIVGLPGI